ncbi:protein adenylyltransferase SelO [Vibrio aestuarianus]|uniref:Protein nucleotidyltransferase YdiU n=1 Tax=Vibrio aestuarianus TaxID=28171 RepID=A0ABM9FRI2_9VIBR|nr:YdiU family protein [Vibrio aestuarianus]MDE1228006.1 YdiU family protein [Vibrio aestuarianus]MDE1257070.1 YdiU family protein [Vibrio aestuarianus]MDE1271472.1 YdiU family protein [Vibrio aestuarianus]MDE1292788.1 YdiU family protein [Vibrio aestuarianus]MDE1306655.1 YdiU family protein [Vibrio aestuarianus]
MSIWDEVKLHNRYGQLPTAFYSKVDPTPLRNVHWVAWNKQLASFLSLPESANDELLVSLSGQALPSQFKPLAMKYAGHQFGVYNPELGDGRGLLLAEIESHSGEVFDLHLKGAGLTPYSRMGDGRAVLRSTIREYLCSEAMAGLGIATTRALAMMSSDTPVYREQQEQGALLVRVAQSHIRFGHFEHFFYTNQLTQQKLLADKVIEWHYPDCLAEEKPYAAMFNRIVDRTAKMIADWQAVGFAHGVMNTDNMSILGQTFDYGPFAFLDDYEPSFISNHSDYQGRYAFDQQPRIALWNLSALAHALSPLVERADLEAALSQFERQLGRYFSQHMRHKLGLLTQQTGDSALFEHMFELLTKNHTDYTRFFRQLSNLDTQGSQAVIDLFLDRGEAKIWLDHYLERCHLETDRFGNLTSLEARCEAMRKVNPKYVLRNYLAQQAIDKAQQGDYQEVQRLVQLLAHPFDEQPENDHYAQLPPQWGKKLTISCSS